MRFRLSILAFASALLVAGSPRLVAQQPSSQPQNTPGSSDSNSSNSNSSNSNSGNSKSSSSSNSSQPASNSQAGSSNSSPSSTTPSKPDQNPPAKKHTTAEDNPFPEDISRKAADSSGGDVPDVPAPTSAARPPYTPPSSGKPSPVGKGSDNSNYSSSRTQFKGIDVMGDGESPVANGDGGYVLNPTLAVKDTKVGQFYLQTGDYKGAYDRFKDATEVDPTNADAVYGLAEAARGLNRKDEAVQNYLLYLDAVPDGGKSKAARKALAELTGGPKK